ncbi:nucleotide sugar epimerase [Paenibacillus agaridevorans]|uniref:Nucleotide sugar epimerase n=1 Tax=Paenibacillus agaridevorans TaxID=171404 RepID=A0A2R5ERG2_9BACL|nr:alpha/beta fold hydrolase [Paenibacillus agaridevorans]GBG09276.1 nucleotide sugar epimerase [Paenibacillus agaridevorans]
MNVFLTGGTGFIGKPLLKRLAAEGHGVYALVRSLSKFETVLEELRMTDRDQTVLPMVGDLTLPKLGLSTENIGQLLACDTFVHAGGPMNIGLDLAEAEIVFRGAAREAAGLAESLVREGKLRHFVHVVGFMSPYDESNALTDLSGAVSHAPPYEIMKFEADSYIRKALRPLEITLSTVNPSVVVGHSVTGETEQTGGLGILVDAVRKGAMPLSPGGTDHWLPMVHVDHTAAFIASLVAKRPAVSDTFYLLDDKRDSLSMPELTGLIARELRVKPPLAAAPPVLIKRLLSWGGNRLLGIPSESMNFIVRKEFTTTSKERVLRGLAVNQEALRRVVADLDYRLSHPGRKLSGDATLHVHEGMTLLALQDGIHPAAGITAEVISGEGNLPSANQPSRLPTTGQPMPLVFVHGIYSAAEQLLPLARAIKHDGPKQILELPGLGRAPYHRHPSVIEGYVEGLARLLRSFDEPVVLIGHSFGGLIAAKATESVPGAVRKLLLLQPALHPVRKAAYRFPKLSARLFRRGSFRLISKQLKKSGTFAMSENVPEDYVRYVREELASPRVLSTTAEIARQLTRADVYLPMLSASVRNKAAILWGEADAVWRIPHALQGCRVDTLPFGHQFPISRPLETAAWIEDQLADRGNSINPVLLSDTP